MKTLVLFLITCAPAISRAEPGGKCEAGICDADQTLRPWVLTDSCQETNDIVGYRRCTRFAEWEAPARAPELAIEIGFGLRRIIAPRPVVTDATTIATPRLVRGSRPMADIATTELRFTRGWQALYVGGELTIGDLSHRTYPYGAFVQGGGVLGVIGVVGPIDLSAEGLIAGRSIRLTTNINRIAPAAREAVIEARLRAAWWLTPWMTVTAEGGASVLDRSEWVAVIGVGVHTRAFGGRR